MPRTCTICGHKDRLKIDSALAAGEVIRGIARRFAVSEDALSRHKVHIAGAIVKASEKREESIGELIHVRLETLYRRTEKILDSAETTGDYRLALQAVREARENLAGIFALLNKAAEANRDEDSNRLAIEVTVLGAPKTLCPVCGKSQRLSP